MRLTIVRDLFPHLIKSVSKRTAALFVASESHARCVARFPIECRNLQGGREAMHDKTTSLLMVLYAALTIVNSDLLTGEQESFKSSASSHKTAV